MSFPWEQVIYSGDVEWRSPGGTLVQFEDSGNISVTGTTVTVSQLIPGTRYHFKVSAITPTGRGAERSIFESTQYYHGKVLGIKKMHHVDGVLECFMCYIPCRKAGILATSNDTSL